MSGNFQFSNFNFFLNQLLCYFHFIFISNSFHGMISPLARLRYNNRSLLFYLYMRHEPKVDGRFILFCPWFFFFLCSKQIIRKAKKRKNNLLLTRHQPSGRSGAKRKIVKTGHRAVTRGSAAVGAVAGAAQGP